MSRNLYGQLMKLTTQIKNCLPIIKPTTVITERQKTTLFVFNTE